MGGLIALKPRGEKKSHGYRQTDETIAPTRREGPSNDEKTVRPSANGAECVAGIVGFQSSAVASVGDGAGGGVRRRLRFGGQTAEIVGSYAV